MRTETTKLKDKIRKQIYNSKPEIKTRLRDQKLYKLYGINLEQYNKLSEFQNDSCKICNKHKNNCNKLGLVVDHNHQNGKIRSLLCNDCNLILGHAKDNIDILKKCINYLEEDINNVSKS